MTKKKDYSRIKGGMEFLFDYGVLLHSSPPPPAPLPPPRALLSRLSARCAWPPPLYAIAKSMIKVDRNPLGAACRRPAHPRPDRRSYCLWGPRDRKTKQRPSVDSGHMPDVVVLNTTENNQGNTPCTDNEAGNMLTMAKK